MSEILFRVNDYAELELRGTGDGRNIYGLVVPFDTPTRISNSQEGNFLEVFKRGSFSKTIQERGDRIRLHVLHDQVRRLPIGRATTLREDSRGLVGEFKVSATRQGDEVLELVRDGALDGLSIGFRSIKENDLWDRDTGRTVERLEVAIEEVSVVAAPAYDDARIVGVRSLSGPFIAAGDAARRLGNILKGNK